MVLWLYVCPVITAFLWSRSRARNCRYFGQLVLEGKKLPHCCPLKQPWLPTAGVPWVCGCPALHRDSSPLAASQPGQADLHCPTLLPRETQQLQVKQQLMEQVTQSPPDQDLPHSQDFLSNISTAILVITHTPWEWHMSKDGITLNATSSAKKHVIHPYQHLCAPILLGPLTPRAGKSL